MTRVHPIEFVESILSANRRIKGVDLSVYRYHPQSLEDDRDVYHVAAAELRQTYELRLAELREGEDIAFHSLVKMDDATEMHFGLLDFLAGENEFAKVERASEILITQYRPCHAMLVFSGRSYHLYMEPLFNPAEWVAFMGRVLLLNFRDQPPTIDPRWIGHRLMAGYGALRWSANKTKPLPEVIREWRSPERTSSPQ